MTEPPGQREGARDDARTPRWVIVFGVVGIVLLVVFLLLHLTGRGFGGHGS